MLDNDKQILNKLYFLSNKIMKIYNKLYELEINNNKNSLLYKKYLKYLDLVIELENETYNKISTNKLDIFINNINNNSILNHSNFSIIINDNNNLYYLKRIHNRLNNIKQSNLMSNYQLNNKTDDFNYTFLNQIIHEDLLNSFIFETNILSNNINNLDYSNGLKMIKYIISFLDNNIENKLRNNNFIIDDKLYILNSIIISYYEIDEKKFDSLLKKYYFNNIYKEIKNISKKDLNTNDYAFQEYRMILRSCLIKAYLAIDKNNIYLKNLIHDIININDSNISKYIKNILDYNNSNITLIKSERLELHGSNK